MTLSYNAKSFENPVRALLTRTLNADFLNRVVNHPDVYPWLGLHEAVDLTAIVENPANVCMVGEQGGFILHNYGNGTYEVHTQFLPGARGGAALRAAREAATYMFLETDCLELLTRVPVGNKAAMAFTGAFGFRKIFERSDAWTCPDGSKCAVQYFVMTFDEWLARDNAVRESGHAFHETIEQAKAKAGSKLEKHPDDEAHNRAAGAAFEMARRGNVEKGVRLYNRWATLAGYVPVEIVRCAPTVIDIRDAVVQVNNGCMEVLLCR